jgi:NADH-quinone oxidoreductase subunit M
MTTREKAIFAPLVVMTLLLGVYPSACDSISSGPSVEALVGNYDTALAQAAAASDVAQPRIRRAGHGMIKLI